MEARVVVGSFHVSSLEAFRAESGGSIATSGAEPEIRRCLLPGLVGLDRWWLDPGPVSILQIPTEGGGFNLATEGIVRRAHAHGQAVQYWTINDIETMEHLIEIGADGIMTDDVVRLRTVLIDAGYEAPLVGWREVSQPLGSGRRGLLVGPVDPRVHCHREPILPGPCSS